MAFKRVFQKIITRVACRNHYLIVSYPFRRKSTKKSTEIVSFSEVTSTQICATGSIRHAGEMSSTNAHGYLS